MNKEILKLAIPNIISNITIPLVGICDLAISGRLNDIAIVGGIGLGATIFTFIYSGLGFLKQGTIGIVSQFFGAKRFRPAVNVLFLSLIISLLFGLFFIGLQKPIESLMMLILSSDSKSVIYALIYFKTRIWAAPAVLGVYSFIGWYIGMQNTIFPMIITIIINLSNIVLSIVFVFYGDMGVYGIALGTVLSQYLGLVFSVLFFLIFYRKVIPLFDYKYIFDLKVLKNFFVINANIFVRSILLAGSIFFFNTISAYSSDEILSINSLLLQFLWFFSYFCDGFAYAGSTICGKYIGRKDKKLLKLAINKTIMFSFVISLLFSLIYFIFGDYILSLLTNNVDLISLSKEYLPWVWLISIFSFLAFAYDGIFLGATATKELRNVMIVVVFVFFVPLSFLFSHYLGNHGLWLAFTLFFLLRGLGLHLYSKRIILRAG